MNSEEIRTLKYIQPENSKYPGAVITIDLVPGVPLERQKIKVTFQDGKSASIRYGEFQRLKAVRIFGRFSFADSPGAGFTLGVSKGGIVHVFDLTYDYKPARLENDIVGVIVHAPGVEALHHAGMGGQDDQQG